MTGTAARGTLRQRAFVGLQYLLPQHFISRLTYIATRVTIAPWKNFLIRMFMRHFAVDLSEAQRSDPRSYASFNDFFTRALRPEARPVDETPGTIVSPVDGTVSAAGRIEDQQLVQAKGRSYTLEALLAGDRLLVETFRGGEFATIYLAPFNYHRIHMPVAGRLTATVHVPGRLFSVNTATAAQVTGLFARNERVICAFDAECGRLALILVGALNVGSMETIWTGEIAPSSHQWPTVMNAPASPVELARGAEMGRFNMGSTVILLCERGRVRWLDSLREGQDVRMGVRIGECVSRSP